MIKGTLLTWTEAICADRVWDEQRDIPRFRKAFRVLMTTCERWPSPKRYLDAMPSNVTAFHKPRLLESEKARQARVASFDEIAKRLNMRKPGDNEPDPPRAA